MRASNFSARLIFRLLGVIPLLGCWLGIAFADDSRLVELIKEGDAADAHSDSHAALAYFLEAEKLSPNDAAILVRISKQYSDLIDTTKPAAEAEKNARTALDYAKRAVELDPKLAKAHLSLAICYGKMTDFTDTKTKLEYSKEIRDETEKAIALDPTDDFAYHVLGRWNYGIASLSPALRFMVKIIYGGLPPASLEDAAKYLKKAAELAPQRIIHHQQLAIVYKALGKTDLAAKEWETVLTLHADDKADEAAQKQAREELKKHNPDTGAREPAGEVVNGNR